MTDRGATFVVLPFELSSRQIWKHLSIHRFVSLPGKIMCYTLLSRLFDCHCYSTSKCVILNSNWALFWRVSHVRLLPLLSPYIMRGRGGPLRHEWFLSMTQTKDRASPSLPISREGVVQDWMWSAVVIHFWIVKYKQEKKRSQLEYPSTIHYLDHYIDCCSSLVT